ncbi:FAD/NAD-P-binding domain-containing protein [Coprinellus micaceus]|uniref:FAD/NAD-P-binding domain-containing protein n=1 Tax=Coprinellus micaceus TaxID=71717 RepID=A0A4Y7TLT3_COPMI|nr:FAD/NAD-P-binding domain-containing protein [Coprinellus micaceus]
MGKLEKKRTFETIASNVAEYLHKPDWWYNPFELVRLVWNVGYILVQWCIIALFKPHYRKTSEPFGRVAIIGAGLTGVSSAAHCIAHGFDVVIYEAGPKLGGIWAHVNRTSGLQLNSLLYRFHPGVLWSRGFPLRDEILEEITGVWKEYDLESRTRFGTKVTKVDKAEAPKGGWETDPDRSRWVVNGGEDGVFDAVIVTVGTCGKPNWIKLPGMPGNVGQDSSDSQPTRDQDAEQPTYSEVLKREDNTSNSSDEEGHSDDSHQPSDGDIFTKRVLHSSELDSDKFDLPPGSRRIVVIGSGASAVEAVETALDRYASAKDDKSDAETKVEIWMIARHDKWIIPRNIVVDTFLSAQPFGRQMPLSFLWEAFMKRWQYRGIEGLVPKDIGIYEGTPVVNDAFLHHVRSGKVHYVRGSPTRLSKNGVVVSPRKGAKKREDGKLDEDDATIVTVGEGEEREIEADVVVLATGFEKPSVDFLPKELFPEGYQRPDLYLQNFSTEDWSILMTNSAYQNAIGTVGHFHIGIYTRILLTLLLDPSARPSPKDMKLWVDVLRFIKRGATGGAFGFFTYMELTIWLLGFHILRPDRLRWLFFIMNGWGVRPRR